MAFLAMPTVTQAFMVVLLALFLRFLWIGYGHRARARAMATKHGIPILDHSWLWGHLHMLGKLLAKYPSDTNGQCTPWLAALEWPESAKYQAMYIDLWPVGYPMLAVFHPEMMAQFCQEPSCLKHELLYHEFAPYTQNKDLVNMEGNEWKTWRSIFNPGFSAKNIFSLVPDMLEEILVFREWLDSIATSGETVRLEDRMMKTTVDIIGRAVFGKRLNCQTTDSELYRIMKHSTSLLITDYSPGAMLNVLNPMRPIHLWRNNRRFKQVCMPYIMENVRNSQNPKQGGKTILDLAIRSYLKEHPEEKNIDSAWTDIALSQFKIFLFAGHDTTTSTLCFTYALLHYNPDKLAKVRAELDEVLGQDPSTYAQTIRQSPEILNRLVYVTAVLKETLRMQPPVGSVRAAPKDFYLIHPETGTKFPAENWMLFSCSFGEQRNPLFFPRPDEFIPERFLAKEGEELYVRKNTFRPFELGPRGCIGQELGMTEMRMIIALTIRDLDFIPQYPQNGPRLFGSLAYQGTDPNEQTAHPRLGMPMKVIARKRQ